MLRIALLLLVLTPAFTSCGSSPPVAELQIDSTPRGASVHMQRIGEKDWEGKLGPIEGDVKSEDYAEEFVYLGTTPVNHETLLEEKESGGTVLGVGGRVMLEFDEAMLRIEKEGFQTLERRIRLQEGEQGYNFTLLPVEAGTE